MNIFELKNSKNSQSFKTVLSFKSSNQRAASSSPFTGTGSADAMSGFYLWFSDGR